MGNKGTSDDEVIKTLEATSQFDQGRNRWMVHWQEFRGTVAVNLPVATKQRDNKWVLLALCLFFSLSLALWWLLDHTYPQWDAANHTKAAVHFANLLKHEHVLSYAWYREFLTVDYQYPLVVNFINGLLKVIFGVSRLSEVVAYVFYQLILLISVYGLALSLFKDKLTAALAVIFINCYPLVSSLSHVQLLDYASLCFNAFALFGIALWLEKPGKKELLCMIAGVALAANCKQISAFFIIVPCLFLFCQCLQKQKYKRLADLVITGGTTALLLALWVVPNFTRLRAAQVVSSAECLKEGSYLSVCLNHTTSYLTGLPSILSPLLFALFVLSLLFLVVKKSSFKPFLLPLSANLGGITIMCLIAASRPELRYIAPVCISASLVSALALSLLWRSGKLVCRVVVCFFVSATLLQYLVFNYSPYPVSLPAAFASSCKAFIQGPLPEGAVDPPSNPLPPGDLWAQEWVVDTVYAADRGARLNVLPSIAEISVHTLEVVALYRKCPFDISTFRRFTLGGDIVVFNQQAIDYYNWYVIKSGSQSGFKFADSISEGNYNRIQYYVEHSGVFSLVGQRPLPDGSVLSLYRRR